jgi:pimeloyl-ACP methyl ester carboxylesterase
MCDLSQHDTRHLGLLISCNNKVPGRAPDQKLRSLPPSRTLISYFPKERTQRRARIYRFLLTSPRFGFGDTTEVPLSQRIPTFLEIIPILLSHLKIPHVTLASHSAGTIYALNFLATYPNLLSPTSPTVYFFSPWVHQSHTSVSFLVLASMLPDPMLNLWDNIIKFAIKSASPAFAASGGAIAVVTDKFKSKETKEKETEECEEGYGISLELKKEVDRLLFKYAFAEYTKGVNDEGRLCLKSTKGTEWYACEDYHDCVRNLAEVWERRVEQGGPELRVNIVLPEDDIMVGEKGMRYFEDCWKIERRGKGIDVECVRIDGTDHESTAHPANEVMGKMLIDAKGDRS